MNSLELLFYFLVFPGFAFTAIVGMMTSWLDRKVTARIQWRVGPPWYQSFADIVKLLGKEIIVPSGNMRIFFVMAPIIGLSAVTVVATLLGVVNLIPSRTFLGDLIVVIYLTMVPSLSMILGASASRNPLASLGASREMKLLLAYELPFVIAIFVPVIKMSGIIRLGEIIQYQTAHGWMITHPSCIIALIVTIMCMQAKLAMVPFDIPEAETEIMGGTLIEYSGSLLALFKLTKMMMFFVVPLFLITIFVGGFSFEGWGLLWSFLKFLCFVVVVTLIRNTNPRVRIDQAVRFFWGPMTILAAVGALLAFLGF